MLKKISKEEAREPTTYEAVVKTLKDDPETCWTINGLLIEKFGVKEKDIKNKQWSDWKKSDSRLYSQIHACLTKLMKEGKVERKKYKQPWIYWWVE